MKCIYIRYNLPFIRQITSIFPGISIIIVYTRLENFYDGMVKKAVY
jgi:hypothetical protein